MSTNRYIFAWFCHGRIKISIFPMMILYASIIALVTINSYHQLACLLCENLSYLRTKIMPQMSVFWKPRTVLKDRKYWNIFQVDNWGDWIIDRKLFLNMMPPSCCAIQSMVISYSTLTYWNFYSIVLLPRYYYFKRFFFLEKGIKKIVHSLIS